MNIYLASSFSRAATRNLGSLIAHAKRFFSLIVYSVGRLSQMCRNNNRVKPFSLALFIPLAHFHFEKGKDQTGENIRNKMDETGIFFFNVFDGCVPVPPRSPMVFYRSLFASCASATESQAVVIRNVKYDRCLHFEGELPPTSVNSFFLGFKK